MIWAVAIGLLALIPILLVAGLRNEIALLDRWILLLTPRGQRIYQDLHERISDEVTVAEVPYRRALRLRKLGSLEEATRLVQVGFDAIADFAPDMLRLLAAMTVFSRMVAAMAPVAPLRPAVFQTRELASLARLHQVLHRFLVSTAERFRFKVYLIGNGLSVVLRFLVRSRTLVAARPTSDLAWRQVEAIHHDFDALTTETLDSFRVLLISLSAERRRGS